MFLLPRQEHIKSSDLATHIQLSDSHQKPFLIWTMKEKTAARKRLPLFEQEAANRIIKIGHFGPMHVSVKEPTLICNGLYRMEVNRQTSTQPGADSGYTYT